MRGFRLGRIIVTLQMVCCSYVWYLSVDNYIGHNIYTLSHNDVNFDYRVYLEMGCV